MTWKKVGNLALTVFVGGAITLAVAASAETIGTAAGVGALQLGFSSTVSGAVSTAATIGTYTVAGGIAVTTLSDAGEIVTDGHNVIRDDMIAPLAGQEHASEIYNNSKLMLTLASLGITQFAADNPQFRPLLKNKHQIVEKSSKTTSLKSDVQLFERKGKSTVNGEFEQFADRATKLHCEPNEENIESRTSLIAKSVDTDISPIEIMETVFNEGKDIVGTSYSEIKPTQLEINEERVNYYINKIKKGENLDPIPVINIKGKGKFLIEGHHRYVASQKMGVEIKIVERTGEGPIGLKDWSAVKWTKWDGLDWIEE